MKPSPRKVPTILEPSENTQPATERHAPRTTKSKKATVPPLPTDKLVKEGAQSRNGKGSCVAKKQSAILLSRVISDNNTQKIDTDAN